MLLLFAMLFLLLIIFKDTIFYTQVFEKVNIITQKIRIIQHFYLKQGRKRPLDTPKRMIERREREGERKVEGEI